MKNTWFYKKIYDSEPYDIDNDYSTTFKWIASSIITPLIGIACIIVSIFQPIMILFGIIVDLYNLWYKKYGGTYEEKKKRKFLKNINNELLIYGKKLNSKKYYLKNYTHYDKPLDEFIWEFFKSFNENYYTCENTLFNEIQICGTNRRRSLGDLYLICKNYYPDCTIDNILKILLKLVKNKKLYYSRCSTIKKTVFYTSYYSEHINTDSKVEYFNNDITMGELIKNLK